MLVLITQLFQSNSSGRFSLALTYRKISSQHLLYEIKHQPTILVFSKYSHPCCFLQLTQHILKKSPLYKPPYFLAFLTRLGDISNIITLQCRLRRLSHSFTFVIRTRITQLFSLLDKTKRRAHGLLCSTTLCPYPTPLAISKAIQQTKFHEKHCGWG